MQVLNKLSGALWRRKFLWNGRSIEITFIMSAQFYAKKFDNIIKLVDLQKDFMMTLCALCFLRWQVLEIV